MAPKPAHKWAFKTSIRRGAFSWRSSAKAIERLKLAVSEVRAVGRADPVAAADGVVALAERIWPAFEAIDTSTGALGTAVRKTLEELIPILIEAPADEPVRSRWLERLRHAIEEDGVDYLAPIADQFGRIAKFPRLASAHADRDLDLVTRIWADHTQFGHVATATLTLSCLLEAGRHDELFALLALRKSRLWFDEKFAAEALLRQEKSDEAVHRAAALLDAERQPWGAEDIAAFCERVLVEQGKADEAYRRFGLPYANGTTWLATWRGLVKRYPNRDARGILEDLIALHGRKGKWFAAAKTAGYFDIALECAADTEADPATLIRAARDHLRKHPDFAAEVSYQATRHLLAGRGYDATPQDLAEAMGYLQAASTAAAQIEAMGQRLRDLMSKPVTAVQMAAELSQRLASWTSDH